MPYAVPLTYTVRVPFTANGVAYAKDRVLTNPEMDGLNLGVLVSSGRLIARPDVHHRRAHEHLGPQPTYIPPGARPSSTALTAGTITVTPDPDPGDELRVTMDSSFPGPTEWHYGDGGSSYQEDGHTTRTYGAAGTYQVMVVSKTHKATATVTVPTARAAAKEADAPKSTPAPKTNTVVGKGQDGPAK